MSFSVFPNAECSNRESMLAQVMCSSDNKTSGDFWEMHKTSQVAAS